MNTAAEMNETLEGMPEDPIAVAIVNGYREGLEPDQFRLDDDRVVRFATMTLWDTLEIQKEAKMPVDKLMGHSQLQFICLAAWRCAVRGGFEMPFADFARNVEYHRLPELGAVLKPFLGKAQSPARLSQD